MSFLSKFANSLFNGYKPSGAYAFEFYDRKSALKEPIETIRLMLAPQRYTIREGYLITTTKTISGAQVTDNGNDFKQINLSGNIHFFLARRPPRGEKPSNGDFGNAAKEFGKRLINQAVEAGKDAATKVLPPFITNSISGFEFVTGLQEMFRLRWVISRMRDKYAFDGSPYGSPIPKDILGVDNLSRKFPYNKSNFDNIMVIYRDYDDNNHFEVIFNDFRIERSANDIFSFDYDISMVAIREERLDSFAIGDVGTKPRVESFASNVAGLLNSLLAPIDRISGYAIDLATGMADIIQSYRELTEPGGIVETMLNERRDKFYLAGQRFKTEFDKVFAYQQKVTEAVEESISATANPELTPSTQTEIAIEQAGQIAEIASTLNQLGAAYNALSNLAPYITNSYEDLQEDELVTITDSEFFDSTDPRFATRQNVPVRYYQVQYGDTPFNLAFRFYRDSNKYNVILKLNKLTITDFDNANMVGKKIKIALLNRIEEPKELRNQIFYPQIFLFASEKEREIASLGSDFKLNVQSAMVADEGGDIDWIHGIEALDANIKDRLENDQGSLGFLHPGWGLLDLSGVANFAENVSELLFEAIENQTEKDPRVVSAKVIRDSVRIEADAVYYTLSVGTELTAEDLQVQIGRRI